MGSVRDERLLRPDGRVVAWSETGVEGGRPLVRLPGTPGSRLSLRADQAPWFERRLRVITVERPGFGASTRLPGRGFTEHADDLAAILDHLGIDRAPLFGGSGAAPHVLAFAARHPDRVSAATIVSGAAPMTEPELAAEIGFNAASDRLARDRDVAGLRALLGAAREAILAAPVDGFRRLLADAPATDQAIMKDAGWQAALPDGLLEALAPGVDGWIDEVIAINGDWADIELDRIRTSIVWTHGEADANCPLPAARRLVARIPGCRLVVHADGGHYTGSSREVELLDELLERAGAAAAAC